MFLPTGDFLEIEDEVKKSIAEQNTIFEVSKYPVKDTDVIRGNKVTKDGDLIHIDEDSDDVANGALDVMAYSHVCLNNYVISRRNGNKRSLWY